MIINIYTDGSCSPNPGKGGWAAILIAENHRKEICGYEENTTNNRMELLAAIRGLEALKKPSEVNLYSDSQYLCGAFSQKWLENWKRNGWKASKKPVLNIDLWMKLDQLNMTHKINWIWVKGHADNLENNRADELANVARDTNKTGGL